MTLKKNLNENLNLFFYHSEWNSSAHPQHVEQKSGDDDGEGNEGDGPPEGHAPFVRKPDREVGQGFCQVILRHDV